MTAAPPDTSETNVWLDLGHKCNFYVFRAQEMCLVAANAILRCWGSAPPNPVAGFEGPLQGFTSRKEKEKKGRGKGKEEKGRKGWEINYWLRP